jgi:hypothetical protein
MNERTTREILAAHAEQLNAGLSGPAAYPAMNSDQLLVLEPLLQLAEQLYHALTPVSPSPAFVRKLGQELALAAARSQLSIIERYRRELLMAAAALGSALSVLGLVLFYLFRQRDTPGSISAT